MCNDACCIGSLLTDDYFKLRPRSSLQDDGCLEPTYKEELVTTVRFSAARVCSCLLSAHGADLSWKCWRNQPRLICLIFSSQQSALQARYNAAGDRVPLYSIRRRGWQLQQCWESLLIIHLFLFALSTVSALVLVWLVFVSSWII